METKGAIIIPYRFGKDGIEVFLTRRAFWNHLHNRPMRAPGEWCATGGRRDGTETLVETVIREFDEEVNYIGEIQSPKFIHRFEESHDGIGICTEAYIAFAPTMDYIGPKNSELIDGNWGTPDYWMRLMLSKEFTDEQLRMFGEIRFENGRALRDYGVTERVLPCKTLQTLLELEEMNTAYKLIAQCIGKSSCAYED